MNEIQSYLSKEVVLSAEDDDALKRHPYRPPSSSPSVSSTPANPESDTAIVNEFLALHRKQPGEGFSQKTEEEIRRKRDELLEKLRQKKGSG